MFGHAKIRTDLCRSTGNIGRVAPLRLENTPFGLKTHLPSLLTRVLGLNDLLNPDKNSAVDVLHLIEHVANYWDLRTTEFNKKLT